MNRRMMIDERPPSVRSHGILFLLLKRLTLKIIIIVGDKNGSLFGVTLQNLSSVKLLRMRV